MGIRKERIIRIVDRLLSDNEDYDSDTMGNIKRLWNDYIGSKKIYIILALPPTIFWAIHPFLTALLTRFLVDDILMVGKGFPMEDLPRQKELFFYYAAGIFTVWIVFLICHWLRNVLIIDAGQQMVQKLREDLHIKLQNLHVGYFERNDTGKIISRVLSDVKLIREWSTTRLINMSANITRFLAGLAILFFINWQLTLLMLIFLPFYSWVFAKMRPMIRRVSIGMRRLNSSLYGLSQERIGGINVVKAFAQEEPEIHTFRFRMNNFVRLSLFLVHQRQLMVMLAGVITTLSTGLIIYTGMTFVKNGTLSLGSVVLFISTLPQIFNQVTALTNMFTEIQAVFVVINRVFFLMDTKQEVIPGAQKLENIKGNITFQNVTFSYPETEKHALKNVSFKIARGESVALMGPSGSGKSTVFQLLCRFYDPQKGHVELDKIDLRDTDPKDLRWHIRLVQQEPVVFSGTIADNMIYGIDDFNPEQIMRASRQAELHDFIMTLPLKYETEVGRNGISLSGGQKQRLALATALLTDPEILLLDDTTSALDAQTESKIRATLNKNLNNRTSIIITQRIATARNCDRILILDEGELVQKGTHDELINQEGFYKKIFKTQEAL
jgi:ABC-type multidrug transport system fused ATPase/permease subunit